MDTLSANNAVFIRELSSHDREHQTHLQYLLPSGCSLYSKWLLTFLREGPMYITYTSIFTKRNTACGAICMEIPKCISQPEILSSAAELLYSVWLTYVLHCLSENTKIFLKLQTRQVFWLLIIQWNVITMLPNVDKHGWGPGFQSAHYTHDTSETDPFLSKNGLKMK